MNKILGTALVVIFFGMMVMLIFEKQKTAHNNFYDNPSNEYEEIMAAYFNEKYPTEPKGVMEKYIDIYEYLYKEDVNDEQFKNLVKLIRKYQDPRLNKINPLDEQMETIKDSITKFEEENKEILGFKINEINDEEYYEEENEKRQVVNVEMVYKGENKNVLLRYGLTKIDNGKWQITVY